MYDSPKITAEWTEAAIVTVAELGDPEEAQAWALAKVESAAPAAPDHPRKWKAIKTTGYPGRWIIEFVAYPVVTPCPYCGGTDASDQNP